MVEVAAFRVVFASNVEDRNCFISQISFGRFATKNRQFLLGKKNGTGKKFVFVSAAGMSNDKLNHKEITLNFEISIVELKMSKNTGQNKDLLVPTGEIIYY